MASINSDGRTIQATFGGGALPPSYGGAGIKVYHDTATLTGVVATNTVTFAEGIPNGSKIFRNLSFIYTTDQGTGGTFSLGDSASATRFISSADGDTAAVTVALTEDATNLSNIYTVAVDNWKPLLTRNTADVTGSPTVDLWIFYLPPTA